MIAARWRRRRTALAVAGVTLWPFVSLWRGALGEVALLPHDGLRYTLPLKLLVARQLCDGTPPLWDPYVFSGFPLLAAMQPGAFFPGTWLFCVLPPLAAANLQMILTYSVAGVGTYAYARRIACTRFAAVFAGCTFAGGGFMVAHLGNMVTPQGMAALPWLLWALESLRRALRFRYVATGAATVAWAVFAGYAPSVMYVLQVAGLYAVGLGLLARPPVGRLRYALAAAATVAIGVLLAAAQLLPTAELGAQSARAQMAFHDFVDYALPWRQLPMLLFPFLFGATAETPYWGARNLWELSGYVGLVPPMLAVAAVSLIRRNRWAAFWVFLTGWGVLLAMGGDTPLARIMYHVPGLNLFRAPGRNLVQVDLALAVLSGLALTAASRRALLTGAAVVAALMLFLAGFAVTLGYVLWQPLALAAVGAADAARIIAALTLANPVIWLPLAGTAAAAVAVGAVARWRSLPAGALLLALHLADLWSFGDVLSGHYPAAAALAQPPPVVRALQGVPFGHPAARVAVLSTDGEATDLRPLLWDVPLVNGFDPLLLERYARFAGIDYAGEITPAAALAHPLVLDLLNARWAVIPRRRVSDGAAAFGPARRLRGAATARFTLAVPQPASGVRVTSFLAFGTGLPDGTPVVRIGLTATDGSSGAIVLRAGDHTAEWCWEAAQAVGAVRHRRAPVGEDFHTDRLGHWYTADLSAGARQIVAAVRVESLLPPGVELALRSIALVDSSSGREYPLAAVDGLLGDRERWRPLDAAAGALVFENRLARPRAWLVRRTIALPPDEALRVVRDGTFADASRFDPGRDALVESAAGRDYGPDADGSVVVVAYDPRRLELETRARAPAFLVVSEIDYPGWRAAVDGTPVPIVRTNAVLRGLEVPAGTHRVQMWFAPRTAFVGLAISLLTAAVLVVVGVQRRRSAAPTSPASGARRP